MGTEKNNQVLYPDQLPSAGSTRLMAIGRRPKVAAKPWRGTSWGGGAHGDISSFISFIKQMVLWRKEAFGSGAVRSWITRGHVSIVPLSSGAITSKGRKLWRNKNSRRQSDWNFLFPWKDHVFFFVVSTTLDLVCTQENWNENNYKKFKSPREKTVFWFLFG